MKTYTAKSLIALPSGAVVRLSGKQAADRLPRMKKLGGERYELKDSLHFKAGETFGYEGDLPKALANEVEESGNGKEKAPKKDDD